MRSRPALLTWLLLVSLCVAVLPTARAEAQQTTLVATGYGGRGSEVMT